VRRLRLAIDASRATLARRTGTENYARQLIRALIALRPPHDLTLYFRDAPPPGLFPESESVVYRVIPARRAWTHTRFAWEIARSRPDVTFVPAHTLPFVFPGPAVVTVHDLGYRFFPEAHPLKERLYLDLTTRYSAHRATLILADSAATRQDLIGQYGIPSDKIRVVYPGVEGLTRADEGQIAAVRAKYGLPDRYLLFLGTLQPRKNIRRLAEAFATYVAESGDPDLGLVLAGKAGWLLDVDRDILPHLPEPIRRRVFTPGYIADPDVAALYSGAVGLTFPSLYEGFGFPVLEAMRCGTPVLCAETSSLPELAGSAALQVDPASVAAIAAGIGALVGLTPQARAERVAAGYAQAARFTWEGAARDCLSALEAAARP